MVILLIEDNQQQAELIKKVLERDLYTIEAAFDGEDAWKKIEIRDYDCIIIDLNLPKIAGEEIIKRIRTLDITTPILVVTANDQAQSKVQNLDNGADDYLIKPFGVDELRARVRALLRRPRNVMPQKFMQGNLEIYYGSREIKLSGRPVKLTKNEFRVLDFLARRPERVCTRMMIQEHVWGYNKELQSNVIEAVIYSLRKKLGNQHKNVVETVKDAGYRFKI